jgi:hypothetical protein
MIETGKEVAEKLIEKGAKTIINRCISDNM